MTTDSRTAPAPLDNRRTRRMLLLLAALFFTPVAVSFFLYYAAGWRPGGQVNHGELITPARVVPAVALTSPDASTLSDNFLRDKWSLIYAGSGACDDKCRAALYTMRQVRLALAEKMDRVQRVFLYEGSCCEQPYFNQEQAGLVAASTQSASGEQVLDVFPASALEAGHIFLVDPLGNLMMSYPPGAPPKGMIEDLKRLLKLSHIG